MKKSLLTFVLLMGFIATFGDGFIIPDFCDDKLDGYYADPLSCNYFYICQNLKTQLFRCPNGLAYNPECCCCDFPLNTPCEPTYRRVKTTCTCSTGSPGFMYECLESHNSSSTCKTNSPCYDGSYPGSVC